MRITYRFITMLVLLFLTACNQVQLVQDVTQEQAHEIVSALHTQGILSRAEKQTGSGSKYTVTVKESLYSSAVVILHSNGLPAKPRDQFSDIVRQKGLMPNSRDIEKLRLDHAIAIQLEEVLNEMPGVIDARAIIRSHFKIDEQRSRASLVLKVHKELNTEILKKEVTDVVISSVPGVSKEEIHLSLYNESIPSLQNSSAGSSQGIQNINGKVLSVPITTFLFGWRVSEEDHNSLSVFFAALLFFIGLVGALIGYWLAFVKKSDTKERFGEPELPNLRTSVLKIDIDEGSDER